MKLRKSREFRKGRIEIIPMIDVMFFLLATFMLASLALQNLNSLPVNLPHGEAEKLTSDAPVTLTITRESALLINKTPVSLDTLAATLRPLLGTGHADVVVNADEAAPEGVVIKAMLRARSAGAQHFLIAVRRD